MRLSVLVLAAAALPGVESVNYISTRSGTCNCVENYCQILTPEACEEAARQIGISGDGDANIIYAANAVAGCSTNNRGNLRFNSFLDSTFVHPNRDEDLHLFCMPCSPLDFGLEQLNHAPCPDDIVVTEPTDDEDMSTTPEQILQADTLCECEGLCSIESLPECEAAAAARGYPDTTANARTSLTMVRGCSTNNKAGLRFNDAPSMRLHTATAGKDVLCKPCEGSTVPIPPIECTLDVVPGSASEPYSIPLDGKCDGAYCMIESAAECQSAADHFGVGSGGVMDVNQNNRVGGCSRSLQDGIVFNEDLQIQRVVHNNGDQETICKACEVTTSTTPPPPVTTTLPQTTQPPVTLSDTPCSGDYCAISSDVDCLAAGAAAASVGGFVTPASVTPVNSNTVPAGCSISASSGLRFNYNSGSTAISSGRGNKFVCELCPSTSSLSDKAGTNDEDRTSSKGDDKWWIYMVGGAATVAVVAGVVVAVTLSKRKSQKAVTPVNRRVEEDVVEAQPSTRSVDITASQSVEI